MTYHAHTATDAQGNPLPENSGPTPGEFKGLRSISKIVEWLEADLQSAGDELTNLKRLVETASKTPIEALDFSKRLSRQLATSIGDFNPVEALLVVEWLFTDTRLPVYLDLANLESGTFSVADARTSRALNDYFLKTNPAAYDSKTRGKTAPAKKKKKTAAAEPPAAVRDAYTGNECSLPPKFPEPKLSVLGNTKLFSNNTGEAKCFFRYGLRDTRTFVVSPENVHRLSAAIFTLAGDDAALVALGAHAVEHNDLLGSFSDFALLDALKPIRLSKDDAEKPPSTSRADYQIPTWEEIEGKVVRKHGGKPLTWNDVGTYTDYAAL